jgi:hypothetical protein
VVCSFLADEAGGKTERLDKRKVKNKDEETGKGMVKEKILMSLRMDKEKSLH